MVTFDEGFDAFDAVGEVTGLFVGKPGEKISSPQDNLEVEFKGIPGDRHYGHQRSSDARTPWYMKQTRIANTRQVTVVSVQELSEISKNLGVPSILPDWLSANIALNIHAVLTTIPVMSRLVFSSGLVLLNMGENLPCIHPGRIIQSFYPDQANLDSRFVKAAMKKRGIVCMVEREGDIQLNDMVGLFSPRAS